MSFLAPRVRPAAARLTIGELARRAGVGVETVRYYEKRGVLAQPPRPSRGFRVYSVQALERLVFIRRAREIGFSVEAIDALLRRRDAREDPCCEVRRVFERQVKALDAAIRELDARRAAIAELVEACEAEEAGARCRTLAELYAGERGRE